MPRRSCHPVRQCRRPPPYLPSSPPARLYHCPLSRLDSIPARQTMEEKFLRAANCLSPSTSAAVPSTRVALCLSHSRYPLYSQSHPKAPRPDGVHWNGCNGMRRVYDKPARVSARKAGQFPRHSAVSLSPLLRAWEPEPERGECRDYEPEADWGASATPAYPFAMPMTAPTMSPDDMLRAYAAKHASETSTEGVNEGRAGVFQDTPHPRFPCV
ncbi:hypothetical protein B0H14DRAFT_1501108 [Mycena olivaceomarginata]|nr:hypothetical protein B0H14DRAFT_1501108 [Mycena olivaceomarginata]